MVPQDPLSMGFPRQSYWSGCHFLLRGIFLTQGSNPVLLHCRQSLYPQSHQRGQFPRVREMNTIKLRQILLQPFSDINFHHLNYYCYSVQFSHSVVSDSLRPHELQHASPPYPSPTPRVGVMKPWSREAGSWGGELPESKSIRPGEGRRLADFWGEAQMEDESPELEVLVQ